MLRFPAHLLAAASYVFLGDDALDTDAVSPAAWRIQFARMHQASSSARRIVITTAGSLGDLHPYVAIALGLKARGHEAIMATGECYRKKIEALGLGFRPVRPDCDWVKDPEVIRRIMHPQWGLVRVFQDIWAPVLRQTYEDLLAATEGADLLVAMQGSHASRLVAEKKGMPWATAMHIPLLLYSAYDPPVLDLPLLPGSGSLSKKLGFLGPAVWKPLGNFTKWATAVWAKPLHRFRRELGLPPDTTLNPLTDGWAPSLHLALFSKLLAAKQPDWPPQTIVTGFAWYDQDGAPGLPHELARFLDAGPPPIVFTLGTAVTHNAGAPKFFDNSVAAAKALGRRAVLIVRETRNRPTALPDSVMACDYAPFSELFPRVAAVVHHGGIGTTALAMGAGRPMLIVPWAWDQSDNANRAERLGISRTIPQRRYTAKRVAAELKCLLGDPAYSRRAAEVAENLGQEDGVGAACDAIETLLQAPTQLGSASFS
jgi:UDP:flavonoid glycosyltransferase YjiC (YdhE family)